MRSVTAGSSSKLLKVRMAASSSRWAASTAVCASRLLCALLELGARGDVLDVPARDHARVWRPEHSVEPPRKQIERIRSEVNHLTTLVGHLDRRAALYSREAGSIAMDVILLLDTLGEMLGFALLGELEEDWVAARSIELA
jgi:hypothetical protein